MKQKKSSDLQQFHKNDIVRKFAFLVLTISIGLCSCSKEYSVEQFQLPKQQTQLPFTDVYLAGSIGDGIHPKATYWKNREAVILTDGSNYAEAVSIVVSDTNVFVAGYEYNGANYVAKYWKNGIAVPLTGGLSPAIAHAITVSGNDVYVAGYEVDVTVHQGDTNFLPVHRGVDTIFLPILPVSSFSTSTITAKYWKNGSAVSLAGGTVAYAISIVGNDVYVAGEGDSGVNGVAKYWKNGIPISLTDGSKDAHAYSIAVSGNDVYVAGSEMAGVSGNFVAEYWKNGIVFTLTDGSNYARANAITISGNDVYAAGAEFKDGNFFVAKYWKNGNAVPITDSSNYSIANSIIVQDNDIYLAGKELKGAFMQGSPVALYWKNGKEVLVQNPSNSGGWTNSIFIVKK